MTTILLIDHLKPGMMLHTLAKMIVLVVSVDKASQMVKVRSIWSGETYDLHISKLQRFDNNLT
jgi:hypothetical protein